MLYIYAIIGFLVGALYGGYNFRQLSIHRAQKSKSAAYLYAATLAANADLDLTELQKKGGNLAIVGDHIELYSISQTVKFKEVKLKKLKVFLLEQAAAAAEAEALRFVGGDKDAQA